MFTTLRRIALALERLAELHAAEVQCLRENNTLQRTARDMVEATNKMIEVSNTRATWYHAESARLQQRVDHLTKQVQQLQVFQ